VQRNPPCAEPDRRGAVSYPPLARIAARIHLASWASAQDFNFDFGSASSTPSVA
jgi:hypothetical protein